MGEVKNLPEVRFKGFSETWVEKYIHEIANRYDNLRIPISASNRVPGSTPYYGANGIQGYIDGYTHDGEFILLAEDGANDLKNYPVIHVNGKVWVNNHAHVLQGIEGKLNNLFLKSTFSKVNFGPFLVGGGRAKLNAEVMMGINLNIPQSTAEQTQIGTFFKNLDNQITLKQRKLDKLVTLKKAMLEKMFPKEGADEPEIRFKGFTGAWLDKSFGQMATFFNGRAYKQEELLSTGKYRVLRVGNFFSNNQWYFSDLELESNKYCDNGDLLYAWSASFGPRIWHGEKVIYHYHIWKVVENDGIDRQFLHLLLDFETENMKSNSANGMGLLHITKGTIEGWECSYPENIGEQKAIGFYFKKLDDLISLQKTELTKLKQIKSSCLEKMFV